MKKILCYADIQIEARVGGLGSRYDEYKYTFTQIEKRIKEYNPDYIIIAGDIFEYNQPTNDEIALFAQHLKNLSDYQIRIINGNHDVKQKFNSIIKDNEIKNVDDAITPIIKLCSDNVKYYKETGFYEDTDFVWSVWSQYTKYQVGENKLPYSPHDLSVSKTFNKPLVELYHDPIKGAKQFDNKPNKLFDNANTSDVFECNTIIAGDIHKHNIYNFGDKTFFYTSSLCQRHFGEGDYYRNSKLYQEANNEHGFVTLNIDEMGISSNIEFHSIKPIVARHTIYIDENFTSVEDLKIKDYNTNLIRLNFESKKHFSKEDEIIKYLKSKYNCSIESVYDKNITLTFDDDIKIESVEELITKEKIEELSESWINQAIDKTKTIDKDSKEIAKYKLKELFLNEFKNMEFSNKTKSLNLIHASISNFMSFGDDVNVDFSKLNGLIKISGANGIGKTTLVKFIAWMFSDRITYNLPTNKKKQNRLLIFNDSRELDKVEGEITFKYDNELYTLKKVLTRKWKGGKPKYFQNEWEKYIVGTPKIEYTLTCGDRKWTDEKEVNLILENILTFDEFNENIFANGSTIETLVKLNSDVLNERLLKILGLDMFDKLNDNYQNMKNERLSTLEKPSETIDQLTNIIGNLSKEQEEIEKYIDEQNTKIQIKEEEIETLNENISEKQTSLHNVKSISELSHERNLILEKTKINQSRIEEINKEITDKEQSSINTTELNNKINDSKLLISEHQNDIKILESNINNIKLKQLDLQNRSTEIVSNIEKEIKNEVEQEKIKILNINTEDSNKELKYNKLKNDLVQELNNKKFKIQDQLSNLNLEQVSISTEINEKNIEISKIEKNIFTHENEIQRIEKEITTLESSKKCPTCDRLLDDKTVNSIKTKIETHKEEIKENQFLINNFKTSITEKENELKSIKENKLKSVEEKINTYKTELNNVKVEDLTIFESTKNECLEITKERQLLKSKISEIEKEIEKIKGSKDSRLSISPEVSEIKESFIKNKAKISDSEIKIKTIKESIISVQEVLKNDENIYSQELNKEKDIKILRDKINTFNISQIELNNDIKNIDEKIELSKKDEIVLKDIYIIKSALEKEKENLRELNKSLNDTKSKLLLNKHEIDKSHKSIENVKIWNLENTVITQYKTMISKSGLSRYIFSKVCNIINIKLNDLLENLPFRLQFNQDTLQLNFIDLDKKTTRSTMFISGMQTCFAGLALMNAISQLNISKQYNMMFIDEISGTLNDGKTLTYKAKNYKELLVTLLHKMKENNNIFIIDHVLDDLQENNCIEIQSSDQGTILRTF